MILASHDTTPEEREALSGGLAEPRKPSKLKSRGFDAGYRPIPSGTPVRRDRSERP